jgi:hypothetical protein
MQCQIARDVERILITRIPLSVLASTRGLDCEYPAFQESPVCGAPIVQRLAFEKCGAWLRFRSMGNWGQVFSCWSTCCCAIFTASIHGRTALHDCSRSCAAACGGVGIYAHCWNPMGQPGVTCECSGRMNRRFHRGFHSDAMGQPPAHFEEKSDPHNDLMKF